jgi:REP element-mobilizing transposase RayT
MNRRRQLKQGASYQVSTKINRDEIIFDGRFSALFIDIVEKCKKKFSFQTKDLIIGGNYVSFTITPGKDSSLPKIMQWINSVFAKAFNKMMGYSGHVWKERYFSKIIETVKQVIETFERMGNEPFEVKSVQDEKESRHRGLYYYLHKLKSIIAIPHNPATS